MQTQYANDTVIGTLSSHKPNKLLLVLLLYSTVFNGTLIITLWDDLCYTVLFSRLSCSGPFSLPLIQHRMNFWHHEQTSNVPLSSAQREPTVAFLPFVFS